MATLVMSLNHQTILDSFTICIILMTFVSVELIVTIVPHQERERERERAKTVIIYLPTYLIERANRTCFCCKQPAH
jgi:hypothetical protein